MISPEGDFFYPDSVEDAAHFARLHGAVPIVGYLCRCMVCCCKPGEGHRSAEVTSRP